MTLEDLKPLTPGGLVPALNPTLVVDGAGLELVEKYFKRIAEQAEPGKTPEFALDYESNITPTFVDRKARLLGVGDKNEQYIIDFLHFAGSKERLTEQGDALGGFKTPTWAKHIVKTLEPALDSAAFLKVGQRLGFEYQVSRWNLGTTMWNFYSTDFAERLIWAGLHSLKDVNFFSLAGMAARYFQVEVDKSKQKTFDLETPLTEEEIVYQCFDLRIPLAIRQLQTRTLRKDQLVRIAQIENDAIGFFEDIHLNGWRTDTEAWEKLAQEWLNNYEDAIKRLDTHFVPIVGSKSVDEGSLEPIMNEWKGLTVPSDEENQLKEKKKGIKDKAEKEAIAAEMLGLEKSRKARAAEARLRYNEQRKKITAAKNIFEKCEGDAAINYGSGAQVMKSLHQMKGFNVHNLPTTDDGVLEKFKGKPVIDAFRDYRKYGKLLETYGPQWTRKFIDSPSAEQGWVNPITGKIHSTINQLEAETGRTSSVKPNIQNLPHDPRVRSCFLADPPDERIRISTCCTEDTYCVISPAGEHHYYCEKCNLPCDTVAEEYVIVTCDMSGAELRIIAEEANYEPWLTAFKNKWDVHSMGTEQLYPDEWPALDQSGKTVKVTKDDGTVVDFVVPPCAYFNARFNSELGREVDHQKCKCPDHLELRDGNKAANFLLAYGGGADALAAQTGKTPEQSQKLMDLHEQKNAELWAYLERSGKEAVRDRESRSRCGRRRRFREPTWELAREAAKERMFESLKKKKKHVLGDGTKLTIDDMHPEKWQISSALKGLFSSIERRGKNHRIQSLNKTIFARAAGSGFCKDGIGYLWHQLRRKDVRGKAKNMVHDEAVVQLPKHKAQLGLTLIMDAFKRAGAEFLTQVEMESEGRIAHCWKK